MGECVEGRLAVIAAASIAFYVRTRYLPHMTMAMTMATRVASAVIFVMLAISNLGALRTPAGRRILPGRPSSYKFMAVSHDEDIEARGRRRPLSRGGLHVLKGQQPESRFPGTPTCTPEPSPLRSSASRRDMLRRSSLLAATVVSPLFLPATGVRSTANRAACSVLRQGVCVAGTAVSFAEPCAKR